MKGKTVSWQRTGFLLFFSKCYDECLFSGTYTWKRQEEKRIIRYPILAQILKKLPDP